MFKRKLLYLSLEILQKLEKLGRIEELKKQSACDIELTIPVPEPSKIHESQEASHTETNIGMLDYEAAKEAPKSNPEPNPRIRKEEVI